jgi:hypothetical protein
VQKQSDKKKIRQDYKNPTDGDYKKGGAVKMAKGGAVKKKSVSSASKRADGIAIKGKTKGRYGLMYLTSNIPYFKCWVRKEFTNGHQNYHGEYIHGSGSCCHDNT